MKPSLRWLSKRFFHSRSCEPVFPFKLLLSITLFLLFYLFGNEYPVLWPDEILFFSPAENLVENGKFATTVLAGLIPGMEENTFWMPPVFLLSSALALWTFGIHLAVARMVTVAYAIGCIWILDSLLRLWGQDVKVRIWTLLLIVSDLLFWKISHTARMESCTAFFFLLSLYLFAQAFRNDANRSLSIILASTAFSLSVLSHPFAVYYSPLVIFVFARGSRSCIRELPLLAIGGLLPLLGWLAYIIPNWPDFLAQFLPQLGRKRELLASFSAVTKIKLFVGGYEYPTQKTLILALGFVASVWYSRRKWRDSFFQILTVWTICVSLGIYLSSEAWYAFHLILPLAIWISLLSSNGNRFGKSILWISFLWSVGLVVYTMSIWWFVDKTPEKYSELNSMLAERLKGSRLIYLQTLPDSYLYLQENLPEARILEFVPGELPVDEKYFSPLLTKVDAFVFYNRNLARKSIGEYLEKNESKFESMEIKVDTKNRKAIRPYAFLYLRKGIHE